MTQSPQDVCTGGMKRYEGRKESKGDVGQEREGRHLHGLGCAEGLRCPALLHGYPPFLQGCVRVGRCGWRM